MDILNDVLKAVFNQQFILQPGFVIEKFGNYRLRNIFVTEGSFVEFENKIAKTIGNDFLYANGKQSGYNYAKALSFPDSNFVFRDKLMDQVTDTFQTTYGSFGNTKVDWKTKKWQLVNNNQIICRINGNGTWMLGGGAGIWAYICRDKTMEGSKTSCEGKGDKACTYIFGKPEEINPKYKFPNLEETELSRKYFSLNSPLPFKSDYGLDLLSKIGFVKYTSSHFDVLSERFFPVECTYLFRLEKELKKINQEKIIYESAYTSFKSIGEKKTLEKFQKPTDAIDFSAKFLSACGWGINQMQIDQNPKIIITGFPWSEDMEFAGFSQYYLGAVSGLISGITQKNIKAEVKKSTTLPGNLNVTIELTKID